MSAKRPYIDPGAVRRLHDAWRNTVRPPRNTDAAAWRRAETLRQLWYLRGGKGVPR